MAGERSQQVADFINRIGEFVAGPRDSRTPADQAFFGSFFDSLAGGFEADADRARNKSVLDDPLRLSPMETAPGGIETAAREILMSVVPLPIKRSRRRAHAKEVVGRFGTAMEKTGSKPVDIRDTKAEALREIRNAGSLEKGQKFGPYSQGQHRRDILEDIQAETQRAYEDHEYRRVMRTLLKPGSGRTAAQAGRALAGFKETDRQRRIAALRTLLTDREFQRSIQEKNRRISKKTSDLVDMVDSDTVTRERQNKLMERVRELEAGYDADPRDYLTKFGDTPAGRAKKMEKVRDALIRIITGQTGPDDETNLLNSEEIIQYILKRPISDEPQ